MHIWVEMKMIYKLLKKFIKLTRPFMWRIARAYSLKVVSFSIAAGKNELVFNGGYAKVSHQVSGYCYFNTAS